MKLVPKGNRIIVTGGAKGFGKAIAMQFARENWRIIIADLNPEQGIETLQELTEAGAQGAHFIQCDITNKEDTNNLYNYTMELWQGLDVLVNNAGIYCGGTFGELTDKNWEPVIETNLLGTFNVTHPFIPLFQKQKSGRIVNISSLSGLLPMPGSSAYSASKAAVFAFSQSLRHEMRPYRVGITVAAPNIFRTDIFKDGDIPNQAIRQSMENSMHTSAIEIDEIAHRVFDAVMNDQFLVTTDEGYQYGEFLSYLGKIFDQFTLDLSALSKSMKNKSGKSKRRETA